MAPIPNPQVIYEKVPDTYPVPGETLVYKPDESKIDIESIELKGTVLVKTQYLSVDPYMRGQMRDPKVKSYSTPAELGKPFQGGGVGVVVKSDNEKFKEGDHVGGYFKWTLYGEYSAEALRPLPELGVSPSVYLGAAGMPAQTAFFGLKAYGDLKEGETIFVSTAAGAVGSIVCQLAKLKGLKVIGTAGDAEKVKFLKDELGIDVAFNYKETKVWDVLEEHGPIDVYFDNVGGEMLDAAIKYSNPEGRILMCGYSSEYNTGDKAAYPINFMQTINTMELHVNGFIVSNLIKKMGLEPFGKEYLPLIKEGKIKYMEDKTQGLENIAEAFVSMLKGDNKGKKIVVVSED